MTIVRLTAQAKYTPLDFTKSRSDSTRWTKIHLPIKVTYTDKLHGVTYEKKFRGIIWGQSADENVYTEERRRYKGTEKLLDASSHTVCEIRYKGKFYLFIFW